MVLTTVPTTALTVNAADQSINVDADASKSADSQSGSDEKKDDSGSGQGGSDLEQGGGDLNQDDSDDQDDGGDDQNDGNDDQNDGNDDQNDGSDNQNNGGDDQNDDSDDQNNGEDQNKDNVIETPVKQPVRKAATLAISPQSAETAEGVRVVFKTLTADGKLSNETLSSSDATIASTNNTMDENGTVMQVPDQDYITFKVTPADGKRLETVKYVVAASEEDLSKGAVSTASPSNDEYRIGSAKISDMIASTDKKVVGIYVGVKDVEYSVTFANGTVATSSAATVKVKNDADAYVDPANPVKVSYGSTLTFYVPKTTFGAPEKAKVTAKASDGSAQPAPISGNVADDTYVEFTLNPAALDKIEKTANDAITVTVDKIADIAVKHAAGQQTITQDNSVAVYEIVDALTTLKTVDEDYAAAKYVNLQAGGTWTPENSAIFGLKQKNRNYVVKNVSAYWEKQSDVDGSVPNAEKHALQVSKDIRTKGQTEVEFYEINLSGITVDATLFVEVEAELDDELSDLKTVSIEGSKDVKAVASDVADSGTNVADAKNLIGTTIKTTANNYTFKVKANNGYVVSGLKYTIEKVYDNEALSNKTDTVSVDCDGKVLAEGEEFESFNTLEQITVPFSGFDTVSNKAENWNAKSVKVEILTTAQTAGTDTIVTFVSQDNYSTGTSHDKGAYEIEPVLVEDQVIKEGSGVKVLAGTEYLTFTVKGAKTEPIVKVGTNAKLAERVESTEEGITYRVPAVALNPKGRDTIWVERAYKVVKVNVDDKASITAKVTDTDEDVDSTGLLKDEADGVANYPDGKVIAADEGYAQFKAYKVNADAKLEVEIKKEASKQTPITQVTYRVGDGAEQSAEYDEANETFTFTAQATDNITVNVIKSTDRKLVIDNAELGEDGVYEANYNDTITATLYNGETPVSLYTTKVMDGSTLAKTVAKIAGDKNSAAIKVHKDEYNSVLTVILTPEKDKDNPIEFKLRSTTPVTGVSYDSTFADGKLEIHVDEEKSAVISMAAENSRLDHLGVATVTSATAKTVTPGAGLDYSTATANNVKADLDTSSGKLWITALPTTNGKPQSTAVTRFVLFDTTEKASGARTIIEGSMVEVTVKASPVADKALEGVAGSSKSTAKTLVIDIPAPSDLIQPVTGEIFYYVSVAPLTGTVPGLTAADITAINAQINSLDKYYWQGDVEKDGGVELNVIPDEIKAPAAGIDKFKVTVGLRQTASAVDYSKTGATLQGDINTKATVRGKDVTITAATAAPVYASTEIGEKLAIKSTNNTIYTGNENWIPVATPTFGTSGYVNVYTEFVDAKSGVTRDDDLPDFTGNSGEYYGLESRFNRATGKVEVRFDTDSEHHPEIIDNYNYLRWNQQGRYKDLGVRVTAVTEKGDYGATGIVKLNVAAGIEDIDVMEQPYILKQPNKSASFKLGVELNGNVKEYKPKSNKVNYAVVSIYGDGAASAEVMNKVTVKNGTVTVAKDFVVDNRNTENNMFRVKVTAADYSGSTVTGYSGDIEISDKSLVEMGDLVIMDIREGDNRAVPVKDLSSIEVTKQFGEYVAVVVSQGVSMNKKTYDLDTLDTVPFNALNLTPAKGNIYIDSETGDIHVNKLGKAKLAATDKTDKKKTVNKEVTFVQKKTNLVLELTQLSDTTAQQNHVIAPSYTQKVDFHGTNTTVFAVSVKDGSSKAANKGNRFWLYDGKVSFGKNVKNITPKTAAEWTSRYGISNMDYEFLITTTGNPGTITLQTKSQGKVDYTLNNLDYVETAAPKVSAVDKKTAVVGDTTMLTYRLSAKDVSSFEGKYVMLSVDGTKTNPVHIKDAFVDENGRKYLDRAIAVQDGDEFTFAISPDEAKAHNINVAVGSLQDGVFKQEYKDAKLAVRVNRAGSGVLKVTGKYTLDPQIMSSVNLAYDGGGRDVTFVNAPVVENGVENYALNAIYNGKQNNFNKYFVVTADEDGAPATIGLKSSIKQEDLNKLFDKKCQDLVGYISVENGAKRVDQKIQIEVKSLQNTLKAAAVNAVLEGTNVAVDVELKSGKNYVPVKSYTVASGDGFEKPAVGFLTVDEEKGISNIHLTNRAGTMMSKGNKKVVLNVVPVYGTDLYAKTPVTVTADIRVIDARNAKNKIAFINKGAENWQISHNDYVGPDAEKKNVDGSWQKSIAYMFRNSLSIKDQTEIKVVTDKNFVEITSDPYNASANRQQFTVKVDKAKAVAAFDKKVNWGKTVNVKATVSYGNTGLQSDTVTLKITLPKDAKSEALKADFEAVEKKIQSLVETTTEYNVERAPITVDAAELTAYWKDCNEELAGKVQRNLYAAAMSGKVNVKVTTSGGTTYAETYRARVTGATGEIYSHEFKANFKKDIAYLVAKINGYKADNWATLKTAALANTADKEKKFLDVKPETTEAQYAAMLREALMASGDITSNIEIKVTKNVKESKAPTTLEAGVYVADIRLIDRSVAPNLGEGVYYADIEGVTYTFLTMQAIGAVGTANSAVNAVEEGLDTNDELAVILGKAWAKNAKVGSDYYDDSIEEAFKKAIVDKANEIIAAGDSVNQTSGNTYLHAEGIEADTFEYTVDTTNANVHGIKSIGFTLILKDSTPKAKQSEIKIPISTDATVANVKEFQTMAGLKDVAVTTASLTIPAVSSKDAAFKAIENKIKTELCKNPALDLKDLSAKDHKTDPKYVGSTKLATGVVNTTITFVEGNEKNVENIIILSGNEDYATGNTADATHVGEFADVKRAEAAIRAELTSDKLSKMIVDMQNKYAENTTANAASEVNEAHVKDEIIKIAKKYLGSATEGTLALKEATEADNFAYTGTPTGSYGAPEAGKDGKIGPFKLTLTYKTNNTDTSDNIPDTGGSAENYDISFEAITLKRNPVFQTADEAVEAFRTAGTGMSTIEIDYVDGVINATGNGFESDVANLNKVIAAKVTETIGSRITNPLYTVVASKSTDPASAVAAGSGSIQSVISNWKVELQKDSSTLANTGDASVKAEFTIGTINMKKEANSPAVTTVAITTVNGGTPAKTGVDKANAIDVYVSDNETVEITATVTANEAAQSDSAYQAMTWKVESEAAAADNTYGTATLEDIKISGTDGNATLTIPADAAGATADVATSGATGGAKRTRVLRITGTTVKNDKTGNTKAVVTYVKLHFVPVVDSLEITKSPTVIERDNDGTWNTSAKFEAKLTGKHLLADEAENSLEWVVTPSDAMTLTGGQIGSTTALNVPSVAITDHDSNADGASATVTVKTKAEFDTARSAGGDRLDPIVSSERTVTFKRNGDGTEEGAPTINLADGVSGVTQGRLSDTDNTMKITVTGKDVKIPLSVTANDGVDRTWNFTVRDGGKNNEDLTELTLNTDYKVQKIGKTSYLIIANSATALADEELNEDGTIKTAAKKITVTAESEASGEYGVVKAKELNLGLVIVKSIDSVGFKVTKTTANAVDTEITEDGSAASYSIDKNADYETTVTLAADVKGKHITAATEEEKVTYKITSQKLSTGKATITGTNGAGTLRIPAGASGFVDVTATYKDTTTKVTMSKKRTIKIVDATTEREVVEFKNGSPVPVENKTIPDSDATHTYTYQVSNIADLSATDITNVTWKAVVDKKDYQDFFTMVATGNASTKKGELVVHSGETIDGKELVAGDYNVTISVSWVEDGVRWETSKTIMVTTEGCVIIEWSSSAADEKWTAGRELDSASPQISLAQSALNAFTVTGTVKPLRYATAVNRNLSARLQVGGNIASGLTNDNFAFDSATGTASLKDITSITKKEESKDLAFRIVFELENESGVKEEVKNILISLTN